MIRDTTDGFAARLETTAQEVAALLEALLSDTLLDGEIARPEHLMAAMRHGVLNGGKRLRPFLVLETARLLGAPEPAAETDLPAEAKLALVNQLARAAGIGGMVGGQALDLDAERVMPDEAGIVQLQAMKTGALLRYACTAGAIAAGADEDVLKRMTRFGEIIGLAFQLADDLLDVTSDAATLGKAAGKDAGRGKGTLVSLHGIEAARRRLDKLVEEAASLLEPFGGKAETLRQAADFIASRDR